MQHKDEKTLYLNKMLGLLLAKIRKEKGLSCNRLANEYGLYSGHICMLENGQIESKVITVWRIAEALGIKMSDLFKLLEDELGEDFKLMDE